jgi:hypothetical protein
LFCLNITGGGQGLSTYNARAYWTPERRKIQSEKAKKFFSRPETKKKHRESLIKAHQTDEYREIRSQISKRIWEEKKERMVLAIHTSEKRKNGNKKVAEKMRKLWKDEEWRKNTLEKIHRGLNTKKSREKRAAAARKTWGKDGYREMQSEKHKSAWTDNMKQAQRERYSLPVICIETGKIYKSGYEAADVVGLKSKGKIREAARKGTTAGGFHWKFG